LPSTALTEANPVARVETIEYVVAKSAFSPLPFDLISDFSVNAYVEVTTHKEIGVFDALVEGVEQISMHLNIPKCQLVFVGSDKRSYQSVKILSPWSRPTYIIVLIN